MYIKIVKVFTIYKNITYLITDEDYNIVYVLYILYYLINKNPNIPITIAILGFMVSG